MAEQMIPSSDDVLAELRKALQAQEHAQKQFKVAEEQQLGAEDAKKPVEEAKEATRRAEELSNGTTFDEYIKACHDHLSKPLQVRCFSSRATKGSIAVPTAKYYCPTELRQWNKFDKQQAEIHNTVRRYLQPANTAAPKLFTPILSLKNTGRRLCRDPLSGQRDLDRVEQEGKELHIEDVVWELRKAATAREELGLGQRLRFDCHTNVLDEATSPENATSRGMQPDQSCVHGLHGKGTTSALWNVVAREAQFYQILRPAQSSAIPVFLGELDMKQTFYLHGAGEIQHMLLMAWGGEPPTKLQWDECPNVRKALKTSHAQIWHLGVRHGDLRRANVFWNEELNRMLVIDFHKSTLIKEQAEEDSRRLQRQPASVVKGIRIIWSLGMEDGRAMIAAAGSKSESLSSMAPSQTSLLAERKGTASTAQVQIPISSPSSSIEWNVAR
ncbi:hypothetical protein KC351_g651 [Hortaea werneckii]|nr:hypothetical protein KC351_g651 [Hortaea werneckii]